MRDYQLFSTKRSGLSKSFRQHEAEEPATPVPSVWELCPEDGSPRGWHGAGMEKCEVVEGDEYAPERVHRELSAQAGRLQ